MGTHKSLESGIIIDHFAIVAGEVVRIDDGVSILASYIVNVGL